MYNILPRKINELAPISGNRNTFGENTYCVKYEDLSFQQKLKVAVDLVRQSILYCDAPNPEDEVEKLCGDSYTSCCVLKKYLIDNSLGKNHVICFVEGKQYETISMPSTHFIVLVADGASNIYQLDPSPMVGYKCGQVETYEHKWYKTCIPIDSNLQSYLMDIRRNIFFIKKYENELYTQKVYDKIYKLKNEHNLFSGYFAKLCILTSDLEQLRIIEETRKINTTGLQKELQKKKKQFTEIQRANGSLEEQLYLIQYIYQIKKELFDITEKRFFLNGNYINISNLTPRYFYEFKLNTVMIKPSSFYVNKSGEFIRQMSGNKQISCGYLVNMGSNFKYGTACMEFFHPDGYKYLEEMFGPGFIFIVNESADRLLERKREIRQKYSQLYNGNVIDWFNGKKVKWTSLGMNMVHSSDNCCEACCNFQSGFPESQLMTRFMYPNPRLVF